MRIGALLLVLALLFPTSVLAHYTQGVGDALVLVRIDEEAGPTLQGVGVYLIAEVPDGYLGFVGPHERDHLAALGVPVEVLVEEDDASLEYLIAFDHEVTVDHVHSEPHPAVRTLFQGENYSVKSVPATVLEAQPNCVPELQRIYRRPLSFVRRPWIERSLEERGMGPDQAIVDALADITQAPLQTQVQTLQDFTTRHSSYNGGLNASLWLRDKFLDYGYSDVTLQSYNNWNDNVVCVKPGTVLADEVVVIGGHYDSINFSNNANAPGADDNASGTVAVLEAARVLADVDFERTIVFICFSGEEQGLVGSDAWASAAASNGTNVIGMINLDMICYRAASDTEDLDVISNTASEPLSDLAFEAMSTYVPELTTVVGSLTSGSSDHAAFWSNGFRAIFLFEDSNSYSPYLHTSGDVVGQSANDFPFMLKNVKGATATIAVLARPFHVSIAHDALGNSETNGPFVVSAEIVSAVPLDAASLELVYRIDDGALQSVPLVAGGMPDEFVATIPAVAPGTRVAYYLTASDVEGFTTTNPDDAPAQLHTFRTGVDFIFADDAEADQGWTLGVAGDNATTGVWIRADPVGTAYQPEDDHTVDPGTLCFVTGNANPGDSDGTNDVDGGHTTLLSPVFDLADVTWSSISYWRWYTDETNSDDVFRIEISNDAGSSWEPLETVTASAYPWVQAVFEDLDSILPLTDQMQLRFIAEDVGNGSLVEALIDDLQIVAVRGSTTGVDDVAGVAPPLARLAALPSPSGPTASLQLVVPHAGRAEVRIFDAKGTLVAKPVDAPLSAGEHSVAMDGLDLGSGVYFARLRLDGRVVATHKLTFVK